MARGINTFKLGAGFNITGQEPIDSRFVVDSTADLWGYEKGSENDPWKTADGKSHVLYNGLVVAIKSTGQLYVLKNRDVYNTEAAWSAVGGDVSADLSALTARVDVLDKLDALQATSGLEVATDGSLKIKLDPAADNALSITDKGIKAIGADYNLVKAGSSSEYAAVYQFMKDGEIVTTINIPKDQFLADAEFVPYVDEETALSYGLVEGDPYLQFKWVADEYGNSKVTYVPVKSLVDVYTSGDYITITDNKVSVNYNELKAKLDTDLKASFEIESITSRISAVEDDVATAKENIATLTANLETTTTKSTENAEAIVALQKDVEEHAIEITGIKGTIDAIKVRNVDTTAVAGISLTHTDSGDDDTDLDTVGISVDTDALAESLKAKLIQDADSVTLTAKIGNLDPDVDEGKPTVQDALTYLESQLDTMAAGGLTGITTETSDVLVITKEAGTTTANINVNTKALISTVAGNIITNKNGKLYAQMAWEAL